jgi:hypothetical protein
MNESMNGRMNEYSNITAGVNDNNKILIFQSPDLISRVTKTTRNKSQLRTEKSQTTELKVPSALPISRLVVFQFLSTATA